LVQFFLPRQLRLVICVRILVFPGALSSLWCFAPCLLFLFLVFARRRFYQDPQGNRSHGCFQNHLIQPSVHRSFYFSLERCAFSLLDLCSCDFPPTLLHFIAAVPLLVNHQLLPRHPLPLISAVSTNLMRLSLSDTRPLLHQSLGPISFHFFFIQLSRREGTPRRLPLASPLWFAPPNWHVRPYVFDRSPLFFLDISLFRGSELFDLRLHLTRPPFYTHHPFAYRYRSLSRL